MISVLSPRISEKAFAAASVENPVYTFVIPSDMNKHTIKTEVEALYGVTVTNVNVSVLKGKNKRFMQRRGRQSSGSRQDLKKAYITLKEGDSIPVFAAEDEEPKTPPTTSGRTKTRKEK